jgi:hypothetical protein
MWGRPSVTQWKRSAWCGALELHANRVGVIRDSARCGGHFQLAMLAYNLNCWLMLFNREEEAKVEQLGHITLGCSARFTKLFSRKARRSVYSELEMFRRQLTDEKIRRRLHRLDRRLLRVATQLENLGEPEK